MFGVQRKLKKNNLPQWHKFCEIKTSFFYSEVVLNANVEDPQKNTNLFNGKNYTLKVVVALLRELKVKQLLDRDLIFSITTAWDKYGSDKDINGVLENDRWYPNVPHKLLSVRKVQLAGMNNIFDDNEVQILMGSKIIMMCKLMINLTSVVFQIKSNKINEWQANSSFVDDYELWHHRLGHTGENEFRKLKSKEMFTDIDQIEIAKINDILCEACINGKKQENLLKKKRIRDI